MMCQTVAQCAIQEYNADDVSNSGTMRYPGVQYG